MVMCVCMLVSCIHIGVNGSKCGSSTNDGVDGTSDSGELHVIGLNGSDCGVQRMMKWTVRPLGKQHVWLETCV